MDAPAFAVAELGGLFDVAPPSNAFEFPFGGVEPYCDNSISEMNSPSTSRVRQDFVFGRWGRPNLTASAPPTPQYHASFPSDLGLVNMLPSPTASTESEEKTTADPTKPAAKRKRENRYKNAPPAVLSRRRAQNRASQRAYRERKDQRIKELEALLDEARQKHDALNQAYTALQAAYKNLSMNGSTQLNRQDQTQMAAAPPPPPPPFVPAQTATRPLDGLGVDMFALPGLGGYPV